MGKYYMSPGVFNIYAPKGQVGDDPREAQWHCAMYSQEDDGPLEMIAIFPSAEPTNLIRGLVEVPEDTAKIVLEQCDNLLPRHKLVPEIKPAA